MVRIQIELCHIPFSFPSGKSCKSCKGKTNILLYFSNIPTCGYAQIYAQYFVFPNNIYCSIVLLILWYNAHYVFPISSIFPKVRIPHLPQTRTASQQSCGAFLMGGPSKACFHKARPAKKHKGPKARDAVPFKPPYQGMSEGFSPTKSRRKRDYF